MRKAMLLPLQLRHIVFPKEAKRRKMVVNLTTAGEQPAAVPVEGKIASEVAAFFQRLFAQAGLDARPYRPEMLLRRLPACLRALRARSLGHARQLLEATPSLVTPAVNSLIIGVTSFFRDPEVFKFLQENILPDLGRTRKGFHLWSAGCSEGSEPYSLAILLAELNQLSNSYLLGTDCRADAIDHARAGCFDAMALRNLSPERVRNYFELHPSGWRVIPALRHAVRWRTADVLKTMEPGIWDVICFRNTAIYLRPEATVPLWERLEAALRPGGVLVLGKAERPVSAKRFSQIGPCTYRRNRC